MSIKYRLLKKKGLNQLIKLMKTDQQLHIVENPEHVFLFDEAASIFEINGFSHSFRKEIEI